MNSQTANTEVRVRFAPSPTGKLHVGGARTAIYNWAFARAHKGTFILRIDDTDPTRSTEENTQIILRAMRWLGLDWDEGPDVGGAFGPYKQTERLDMYRQAAQKLVEEGKAYYCFCSQETLDAARKTAQEQHARFQGYNRACRGISLDVAKERIAHGEPYTIRVKVPLNRGDVVVHDLIHGDVTFNARELDDFIIFRSDGTPTYNFATVCDDAAMKITHIIRGDDHLSNTPRQVIVYEALGAQVPVFAHLSMILGVDGKKLSKRHGATSVEEYRDSGYDSEAFVNYLALLGWALDGETTIVPKDVLMQKFSLEHISKNPATFDPKKLDWINAQYMQRLSDNDFAHHILIPELIKAGLEMPKTTNACTDSGTGDVAEGADETMDIHESDVSACFDKRPSWYLLLASILKPRTTLAHDVVEKARFLYQGKNLCIDEPSLTKNIYNNESAGAALDAAYTALKEVGDWTSEHIDAAMAELPEKLGATKRKFFAAIRVAECGNQVSPPLGESMELLGRELALFRLENALKLLEAHNS